MNLVAQAGTDDLSVYAGGNNDGGVGAPGSATLLPWGDALVAGSVCEATYSCRAVRTTVPICAAVKTDPAPGPRTLSA